MIRFSNTTGQIPQGLFPPTDRANLKKSVLSCFYFTDSPVKCCQPDCLPKLVLKLHTLFANVTYKVYIRKLLHITKQGYKSIVYLVTATEQELSIMLTEYCFNFKASVCPQRRLKQFLKHIHLTIRFLKIKLACQSSFVFITGFIKMYLFCPDQTVWINFKYKKMKKCFMENIPESCETLKKHLDWSQHNPMTHPCK